MTILVALVVAPVALPTTALGQSSAGVDEYVEELPGAGGGKPGKGDDGGDGGDGPLTPAQVTSLEDLGSDGAAVAALAQGSGPPANRTGSGDGRDPAASQSDDRSGVADVVGTLTGGSDSGSGVALPIVLAAALVAAIAFLLVRRIRGRPGPA